MTIRYIVPSANYYNELFASDNLEKAATIYFLLILYQFFFYSETPLGISLFCFYIIFHLFFFLAILFFWPIMLKI